MSNFILGELVTLKYHPYFDSVVHIYISADSIMTPPIMVITEILESFIEDKNNDEQVKKIQEQIKCIFYSHKNHKYEENWFLPEQVKKISDSQSNLRKINDIKNEGGVIKDIIHKNVILKTWKTELGKKKISLNDNNSNLHTNKTITANLNFLPPVMTILRVTENNRNNIIEKKPLRRERKESLFFYTCRWFNPKTDSFSEGKFSPDALELVENDENLVSMFDDFISNEIVFKFNNPNMTINEGYTMGKALKITYNHCHYELEYFDFIKNKPEILNLEGFKIKNFTSITKPVLKFAPSFSEIQIGLSVIDFIKLKIMDKSTLSKKRIFRIK
ncbi:MAG: hypothetical protein WAM46_14210, partial [Flavobacterium sp.]